VILWCVWCVCARACLCECVYVLMWSVCGVCLRAIVCMLCVCRVCVSVRIVSVVCGACALVYVRAFMV
jgi:hypothetical protein